MKEIGNHYGLTVEKVLAAEKVLLSKNAYFRTSKYL